MQWDVEQARLQQRAQELRAQLGIDDALCRIGSPTLVGSAALGVMVALDIDLTVAVAELDLEVRRAVADLAAQLSTRGDVREVRLRDDTGTWNTDPLYPDGLYLQVECADAVGDRWTFDIWFVDEPDRQPDLQHLRTIGQRITVDAQAAILAIKRATRGHDQDGSRLSSFTIYEAVLERGARSVDDLWRLV